MSLGNAVLCALLLGSASMVTGCGGGGSGTTTYDSYADTENYSASVMEGESVSIDLETGLIYATAPEAPAEAEGDKEAMIAEDDMGDIGAEENATVEDEIFAGGAQFKMHTFPEHGVVFLSGNILTYQPDGGFLGKDSVKLTYGAEEDLNFKYVRVDFTVKEVNYPPEIKMGNILTKLSTDTNFSFGPFANDPDGGTLTFSIVGNPGWMTLDPATGMLSGTTPNYEDTTEEIRISVSDGILSSSLEPFTVDVVISNHAPTIEGVPTTYIDKNEYYSFTPIAKDADGDTLTFYIANKPSWATFDSATGTLEGVTPDMDYVYNDVSIYVYDGESLAYLEPFTITVGVVEE